MQTILIALVIVILILIIFGKKIFCKCELPGPALVKVFMADDGLPDVNVEPLIVYPGQKVVFKGPTKFSLIFRKTSPTSTKNTDERFDTDNGEIDITVSEEFSRVLKDCLNENNKQPKDDEVCEDTDADARAIEIKYDVIVGDKIRDPRMKIIEK